jgi:hypothetical protein
VALNIKSLTWREDCELRVLWKKLLRRIVIPKWLDVTRDEELYNLISFGNVLTVK